MGDERLRTQSLGWRMLRRRKPDLAWADHYWVRELATYNSEKARGLIHTAEWTEQMRRAQDRFDEMSRQSFGLGES